MRLVTVGAISVSEREFTDQVVALARLCGWLVIHFRPARSEQGWRTPLQGHPGFPDLVMVRGGELIFAELKSATGRLTAEQRRWIEALDGAGANSFVWKPSDWDAIEWRLR